jgi:hypothetical protein
VQDESRHQLAPGGGFFFASTVSICAEIPAEDCFGLKSETVNCRRPHLPLFVARVREGVPRSPCALVSARLVRKPLRKIGVILLQDVEQRFRGELAMVFGK